MEHTFHLTSGLVDMASDGIGLYFSTYCLALNESCTLYSSYVNIPQEICKTKFRIVRFITQYLFFLHCNYFG